MNRKSMPINITMRMKVFMTNGATAAARAAASTSLSAAA
jgi:hypothetical protein